MTDEVIISYINEKLGKKIEKLEELTKDSSIDDPYIKELYEWRKKTGRPIEDWFKFQKDYDKMSDLDVVRENLQYKYSDMTPDEIEVMLEELKPDELDSESEKLKKQVELKKLAHDARGALKELVSEFGTPQQSNVPKEVEEKLKFIDDIKHQIEENKVEQEKYINSLKKAAESINELDLALSDKLSIKYRIPQNEKKDIIDFVTNASDWKDENGRLIPEKIIADAVKVKHHEKMLKIAFEQGYNSGKEDEIKEINNINIGQPNNNPQTRSSKGVVIEGLDKFIGGQKIKIRK